MSITPGWSFSRSPMPLRAVFMEQCSETEFRDVVWLRDNLEEFEITESDDKSI
ncbi:hypothetical protein SCLCIDRAFT_1219587, partial [Scleroderma citrinum Foug A]